MVAKLTWQVIEDNGGGLHLVVFEGGRVIFYGHGYEHNEAGLRADLAALRNGDDPRTGGWEMPVDDPQAAYDDLTSHPSPSGWVVVADQDGVYYDRMGAAAQRVLAPFLAPYNGGETPPGVIDTLAQDLFAIYRRKLADSLETCEDELASMAQHLADTDFETLAAAQDAAEEAAWAEARRADPEWPRTGSDEERAVAEAFQRLRYEAGY